MSQGVLDALRLQERLSETGQMPRAPRKPVVSHRVAKQGRTYRVESNPTLTAVAQLVRAAVATTFTEVQESRSLVRVQPAVTPFSMEVEVTDEVWKRVPGMQGIWASSWGRIKSDPYEQTLPSGGVYVRQIRPTFGSISKADRTGNYFRMRLNIRRKTHKVHILVCSAFHGKREKKSDVVIHKDDNGMNNREENLRWGTQYENLAAPRFRALMQERACARERAVTGRFR